jgi:hypothetical protein
VDADCAPGRREAIAGGLLEGSGCPGRIARTSNVYTGSEGEIVAQGKSVPSGRANSRLFRSLRPSFDSLPTRPERATFDLVELFTARATMGKGNAQQTAVGTRAPPLLHP